MKKSTIILIPVVIIILVIFGAFLFRTGELNRESSPGGAAELPGASGEALSQPDSGLGSADTVGVSEGTGAGTDQTDDLQRELDTTADDGGTSDLQNIQNDAAGL